MLQQQTKPIVVSSAHISTCVSAFYFIRGERFRLGHACLNIGPDSYTTLGLFLFDMNAAAVRETLKKGETLPNYRAAPFPKPAFRGPPAAMFKAVQFLLQQCGVGTVPRDWALYKDLAELLCALGCHIVISTPEYAAAPWHVERGLSLVRA